MDNMWETGWLEPKVVLHIIMDNKHILFNAMLVCSSLSMEIPPKAARIEKRNAASYHAVSDDEL